MTGYADTALFGPSNALTRAEFATVLHRIVDPEAAGVDFTTVKNETGFADVEYGNYVVPEQPCLYEKTLGPQGPSVF